MKGAQKAQENMTKYLPFVLVLIALVFGISYFHEVKVTKVHRSDVIREISSGEATL